MNPYNGLIVGDAGDCKLRQEVFAAHSGKGRAECSVPSCKVRNFACLQIDHLGDDGYLHRGNSRRAGVPFYRKLRREGYPPGYRTFCANHHAIKTQAAYRNGRTKPRRK